MIEAKRLEANSKTPIFELPKIPFPTAIIINAGPELTQKWSIFSAFLFEISLFE